MGVAHLLMSAERSQKPALVYLCQRLPFPPTTGERIPTFNFLRHLSTRYRVFLGTFIDQPDDARYVEALRPMVSGLHVATIRKPQAYLRALPSWLVGMPISFALFRDRGLLQWLRQIESTESPEAVFAFSSNVAAYAIKPFRRAHAAEPFRFLHFCDVDSAKFEAYAQQASWLKSIIFRMEASRVRREEQRLTDAADLVGLISDDEAALLRRRLVRHTQRVVTLPNGVDAERFDRRAYPETPFASHGATFMFTGAMDYPPNIEAVTWFAQQVFPLIRLRIPHAEFYIVGTRPTAEVRRLSEKAGVVVTGPVESTAAYMAHAQVAVAPLQVARGVQNKVLEAMSMSLPVVATPAALTGIAAEPGTHLLSADGIEPWAQACVGLIQDPSRAEQLGQAARSLVCDRYTWDAQCALLDRFLTARTRMAL